MMNPRLREGQSPKFPQVEREGCRLEPCLPSISPALFHKPEIAQVWEPHQVLCSLPFFNLAALSFSPWGSGCQSHCWWGAPSITHQQARTRAGWATCVT